ncbi:undecaprenyl-diphosphate phosphatase [Alicyclobacillus tolerans]|uniref:undecaprenyl-diphosphate phosphatase n=1 Tax=Alicyclobacillus tolerans TaxID=90970 RepID=UPI001F2EDB3C|nr:undecaprenyl-diphosphate phosphatase [Alicyclobacillus tolerans]MCF8563777.1 undecaprenyl-diphosphate phosphatase [Alicyclobacillus tolerans]
MTTWQALILGLVQGITEFLPISSSGHLVILQRLWHISGNELLFITFLHLGTVLAVVWALRREVKALIHRPLSWNALMIYAALVPTAVIGWAFEDWFEGLFKSGMTIGFEFVITGIILWWLDSVNVKGKRLEDMTLKDSLWIGTLQGAAILPALSRSGLTIAGGLWRGLDRDAAGRFSFLLSIPAILGATVVELDDLFEHPAAQSSIAWTQILVGTAAAVVAGYISVKGTLWLIRRSKMRVFAIYVWIVAAFILADQLFFHHWFPSLLK